MVIYKSYLLVFIRQRLLLSTEFAGLGDDHDVSPFSQSAKARKVQGRAISRMPGQLFFCYLFTFFCGDVLNSSTSPLCILSVALGNFAPVSQLIITKIAIANTIALGPTKKLFTSHGIATVSLFRLSLVL